MDPVVTTNLNHISESNLEEQTLNWKVVIVSLSFCTWEGRPRLQ